jgi:hypothetical protein
MASKRVPIPYPSKGISENYGFNYQEERTCRDDRNVRTIDPRTGRMRGAQRAGLGVYANGTVANGTEKIKAMCAVSNAQTQLSYGQDLAGSERWTNAGETNGHIIDMRRGLYGSYYAVTSNNQALILNEDGEELHRISIPEVEPTGTQRVFASCISVDEYQNIFVGTSATSDADAADCAMYIYRFNEDDTYKLVYTITYGEQVLDVHAAKGKIYVLTATTPHGNASYDPALDGNTDYLSYWRARVYEDYFPLENAPSENNDLRISKSLQTRPTDGQVIGIGSFYYNDQSVGRLSVNDSGGVLMSIASIGAGKQEWGWLGWLDPGAEQSTLVVDSLEVSKWYHIGGVAYGTNGIGLDAQWGGVEGDEKERVVWSAGDPIVGFRQVVLDSSVVPAPNDALKVYGPSASGAEGNSVTIYFNISGAANDITITGSGPWDWIVVTGGGGSLPINAQEVAEALTSAMEAVVAHSDFSTKGVNTRIIRGAANSTALQILSPDPNRLFTTSDGYVQVSVHANSWATPESQTAWNQQKVGIRRAIIETPASGAILSIVHADAVGIAVGGTFTGSTPQASFIRIGQDKTNGAYFPWGRASTVAAYNAKDVLYIPNDIDTVTAFTLGGPTYIAAAAAPLFTPDYGDHSGFTHTPFVLIAGPEVDTKSIHRYDIVTITQAVVNPRAVTVVAASGAKLLRITSASPYVGEVGGTANPFDAAAPYIQMVAGYEKVYITDGHKYWMYDPKATDSDDDGEVSLLVSKTYGTVPPRCRLIEMWRGRLVLARDPADPGRWHMSAIGDPHDWDTFPQVANAAQAVSSTSSKAGTVPDIINAVVPWTDDILLFGGDSSIWALSGDPMAGGVMDLVTDETGMSFGRPYCKDPTGALWFFGSTGGLYTMQRGTVPARVSLGKIERQLREVNLANYYIQLQWNQVDEGIHIFQIPFGAGGTIVNHWFYEAKADAFHKDKFGLVGTDNIQPTAVIRLDGDTADDRTLLMGCEDGRIRKWGRGSGGAIPKSDEKTTSTSLAIDSYILIGPLVNDPTQYAQQVTELDAVLSSSQNGCNFEIFTSDEPDSLGLPAATGSFTAGRNDRRLVRTSGDHVYLQLRNATAGECWAFEGASALVSYGGEVRK